MSTRPNVVEFKNVRQIFNIGTPREYMAVTDLNFAVEDLEKKGELITMLGPSGCGKSTILNLIAGFRGYVPPTQGEVLVFGKPVAGPGPDRGMVFQKYSSFPHLTVLDNVKFGLNACNRGKPENRTDMAMQWIKKVGLGGHENKYPRQLSGGQQQRVALARSLVLAPRIILMDEPFSALDEPTRIEMQRLTVELWHEVEATVFLVTHSIAEAVYLADRVWIFASNPGRLEVEITDALPPKRGEDPLSAQEHSDFKEAVQLVTHEFQRVNP